MASSNRTKCGLNSPDETDMPHSKWTVCFTALPSPLLVTREPRCFLHKACLILRSERYLWSFDDFPLGCWNLQDDEKDFANYSERCTWQRFRKEATFTVGTKTPANVHRTIAKPNLKKFSKEISRQSSAESEIVFLSPIKSRCRPYNVTIRA